jgi:hypothetical protein
MLNNLRHLINRLSINNKTTLVMQNPFGTPTYQVGNQIYRRNCPLEMVNTTNPAVDVTRKYNDMEEEERTCELIEETKDDLLTNEDDTAGFLEFKNKATSLEISQKEKEYSNFVKDEHEPHLNKELNSPLPKKIQIEQQVIEKQQIIGNEDSLIIETEKEIKLIDSVKYDSKESCYNDKFFLNLKLKNLILSIQIPGALIGLIKGKEGYKQRVMEKQFECRLHFPKKRAKVHGKLVEISNFLNFNFDPNTFILTEITSAHSAEHVKKCRNAMESAVDKARKQAMPTHFVAVPVGLKNVKIREQYANLVHTIRADEDLPV